MPEEASEIQQQEPHNTTPLCNAAAAPAAAPPHLLPQKRANALLISVAVAAAAMLLSYIVLPSSNYGSTSYGSDSFLFDKAACGATKDQKEEGPFLNLTALLNLTSTDIPVGSNNASQNWLARLMQPARRQPKATSIPQVHLLYMADAYVTQQQMQQADAAAAGRAPVFFLMCRVYCCRQKSAMAGASAEQQLLPVMAQYNWLKQLHHASEEKSLKVSTIASAASPPSEHPMVQFLHAMQGKVPEDWHLQGFRDALARSCEHLSMMGTSFDDALVPSRLCSSTAPSPTGATIGNLLR